MKLLKKLTKVISAVLASVAVFSAGFSASALADKCAIIERPDETRLYNIEQLEGLGVKIVIRNTEGKALFGILYRSARYYLLDLSSRSSAPLFNINLPSSGSYATAYQIGYSDDTCHRAATPIKLDEKLGKISGKILSQRWKINDDRYVRFASLTKPKPTSPDYVGHILDSHDKELATIYTKGFTPHMMHVITFLATVALI